MAKIDREHLKRMGEEWLENIRKDKEKVMAYQGRMYTVTNNTLHSNPKTERYSLTDIPYPLFFKMNIEVICETCGEKGKLYHSKLFGCTVSCKCGSFKQL